MEKSFWQSYFSELKKFFKQNVLFVPILVLFVVTSPIGYSFLSWYATEVPATLISHDPVAYPHKYKQKVEYRYYATFYFPDINSNKTIEIAERTHFHAKAGDVYLFPRQHKLQTGAYNIYMFASLIQCIVAFMSIACLIGHFFMFVNRYFSTPSKVSGH